VLAIVFMPPVVAAFPALAGILGSIGITLGAGSWLMAGLIGFVAYMIDPDTVMELVSSTGEFVTEIADVVLETVGDITDIVVDETIGVLDNALSALLGSNIGMIGLIGLGIYLISSPKNGGTASVDYQKDLNETEPKGAQLALSSDGAVEDFPDNNTEFYGI
jgi:hypothetical protein